MMHYNLLGGTGVLVSELCLGTMSFGGQGFWKVVGQQQEADALALVRLFAEAGGNFIDTADVYSDGESERIVGSALRQVDFPRDHWVLATKARLRMGPGVNQVGLSRRHLMQAVDDSLRRLQTDYIDLYQLHGVDLLTPLEETMRGLEDLVRSGKVRYIGASNLPAWQMAMANGIADRRGWTRFVSSQNYYSLAGRDVEHEIVPMLQQNRMALLPWSPLAGGFLSGKFSRQSPRPEGARRSAFDFPPLDVERTYALIDMLERVAGEHRAEGRSASVATVALAWLLRQPTVTSVIVGAKRPEQLQENLQATSLALELTDNDLYRLNEVSQTPPHYPGWMMEFQATDRLPQ